MSHFVGNDLVDLTSEEFLSGQDDRRCRRVLAPSELDSLEKSSSASGRVLYFWRVWAAKESAYKVAKKLDPDCVFSPVQFVVDSREGLVTYKGLTFFVQWEVSEKWIHCVCTNVESQAVSHELEWQVSLASEIGYHPEDFLPHEKVSIHSVESGLVRQMLKNLLKKKGLSHFQIVRRPLGVKFAPPELWHDGVCTSGWDISMSHDGKYVAACLLKT